MQYFKNRLFKTISIALLPLLIIAMFVYFLTHNKKSGDLRPDMSIRDKPEEYNYDNFRADKISIVKRENNKILFSLSADKVIHRKRISKLFVYQNLKEIYISGLKIDIYPYNTATFSKHKSIKIPVIDIGSIFTSLGKPSTQIKDYLSGKADIDLDLLTRLLIEDLSININLQYNKKIFISARGACINANLENIVLTGLVKIIASDGKELLASQAIWSEKFDGIYLHDGYLLHNKKHKGKAFFAMSEEGYFKRASLPDILYKDPIEDAEKILYTNLSKKMPVYLRFITEMPGGYEKTW